MLRDSILSFCMLILAGHPAGMGAERRAGKFDEY